MPRQFNSQRMKYRFKKEFQDSIIVLPLVKKQISNDTLQDSDVEFIKQKYPHLLHNFEEVPAPAKRKTTTKKTSQKTTEK